MGAPQVTIRPAGSIQGKRARGVMAEPTGLLGAVVAGLGCSLLSLLLWAPLSWPAGMIRGAIPAGDCRGVAPGLLTSLCGMKLAATPLLAPLGLLVLALVFRKPLGAAVAVARRRLPAGIGILVAPGLATIVFALSWAGGHAALPGERGLLPQIAFPGAVGLFTYAIARWGPLLHRGLRPLFDLRDRTSMRLRVLAVIAVPTAVSIWLAAGSRTPSQPYNEQLVVLVGLATGFLIVSPRQRRAEPKRRG